MVATVPLATAIWSLTSLLAATGLVPYYYDTDSLSPTLAGSIARDLGATLTATLLSIGWIKLVTLMAAPGGSRLNTHDARKVIHTTSGPLFLLLFPLWTSQGRWFCVTVPLLNGIRLLQSVHRASSKRSNEHQPQGELAFAVSRSGDPIEATGGPLLYVVVVIVCVIIFWRESVVGVIAIGTLAAGDGVADLIGRRWGHTNRWSIIGICDKSMAGSAAFVVAAVVVCAGLLYWMEWTECLREPLPHDLWGRLLIVATGSSCVELLPIAVDDNLTVPLAAIVLSLLLF